MPKTQKVFRGDEHDNGSRDWKKMQLMARKLCKLREIEELWEAGETGQGTAEHLWECSGLYGID